MVQYRGRERAAFYSGAIFYCQNHEFMKVLNRRGIRGSTTPLLFVWFFDYLVFNGTAGPHVSLDTLNPPLYARYIIEATRPLNFSLLEPFARARASQREEIFEANRFSKNDGVCDCSRRSIL